ncbi:MAG TPA: bifunctional UDP-sugar hydrolase/5'-nucleotidase [Myxococcaceae bacterium]|nr:bifunctional UDP-sugar hydrolase/5'-nucleotidase [Myxococcaceae bacterium]
MPLPLRVALLSALCAATACRTPTAPAPIGPEKRSPATGSEPIRITIVGTNDLHGWVYPHKNKLPSGQEMEEGGSAVFAWYLAILRADNPGGTLLLDAGDLFQGTLASNLTEGSVVIDVYNALGYQAAAIGNHEFDYGPVGPVSVANSPDMDPFGALKERMKQAHFPLLAVNIYDAKGAERPSWLGNDGTYLLEVKGVRVGIVGLITPSTPYTTNPVNVASLRFGSLAPEALTAVKKLRERGAEIVIAVAHAGGRCANVEDPHSLATCDLQSGEIFEALDQLPAHTFDAVVAGHTHAQIGQFVRDAPVIETPGLGGAFGTIDLYVDPVTRKVIPEKTAIKPVIPICEQVDAATGQCDPRRIKDLKAVKLQPATFLGRPIVRDPSVDKVIAPALAMVEADQHRKLGVKIPEQLSRNYEGESTLGDVLSDAIREMEGADLALLNPGGIRADLPSGDLTYGDVYDVLPFDNTMADVTLTGEELKRLLNTAYGGRKGVFQISGMTVQLARCAGPARLKNATFSDGKPIASEKKYKLAVPDFLARGGDGLGPVMSALPANRIDLGTGRELNFRDSLVSYWQKRGKNLVAPKSPRISYVDDGSVCESAAKAARPEPATAHP